MSRQRKQNTIGLPANKNPIEGKKRSCPQCGKEFFPTRAWAYRNNKRVWCSWKCLREDENGIPPHVQPEPEPARPLTDEQMARLAEIDAHEQKVAAEIPVMISREKREQAEEKRGRKTGFFFRSERTERMARAAYETIQEGGSIAAMAEEYGVTTAVLYAQAAHWRKVNNLPAITLKDRQSRAGKGRAVQQGLTLNQSAEKTARVAECFRRLRALLAEIREEAGISA